MEAKRSERNIGAGKENASVLRLIVAIDGDDAIPDRLAVAPLHQPAWRTDDPLILDTRHPKS
jgi:hypothetical protein